MAKEATLQLRMEAELKEHAENLYREMGTSFAEAVRIFAKQSVISNGLPFSVTASGNKTYGMLSEYADPLLIADEKDAYTAAMTKKHAKSNWYKCNFIASLIKNFAKCCGRNIFCSFRVNSKAILSFHRSVSFC